MSSPQRSLRMSYPEYVVFEQASPSRHEYLRGEVFDMAGGSPEHAQLQLAFGAEVRARLAGGSCRVFGSDLRVRIEETDFACYPDVTIVCGEVRRAPQDGDAVVNPTVVVEILSDSTEAFDRGGKAAHYRAIPSVREIVFVSQRERMVEVQRRNELGRFEIFLWREAGEVELAALDLRIPLLALYRDVPLGAAAT